MCYETQQRFHFAGLSLARGYTSCRPPRRLARRSKDRMRDLPRIPSVPTPPNPPGFPVRLQRHPRRKSCCRVPRRRHAQSHPMCHRRREGKGAAAKRLGRAATPAGSRSSPDLLQPLPSSPRPQQTPTCTTSPASLAPEAQRIQDELRRLRQDAKARRTFYEQLRRTVERVRSGLPDEDPQKAVSPRPASFLSLSLLWNLRIRWIQTSQTSPRPRNLRAGKSRKVRAAALTGPPTSAWSIGQRLTARLCRWLLP